MQYVRIFFDIVLICLKRKRSRKNSSFAAVYRAFCALVEKGESIVNVRYLRREDNNDLNERLGRDNVYDDTLAEHSERYP